MDDAALLGQVLEELACDPSIEGGRLCVQVQDGVVRLTGTVGSYAEKCRVVRAVRRIRGVDDSTTEISVREEEGRAASDDVLRRRILDGIFWSATIPADAVRVSVRRGWVTLSGSVQWDYQRRQCERMAGDLAGVAGIVNLLTVRPRFGVIDVEATALRALRRNADVRSPDIKVRFVGGDVTLTGAVRSWHERKVIRRAIWSIPGVATVRDRMVTRRHPGQGQ